MTQTSLFQQEESNTLSPVSKIALPKDKDLPPIIREIVSNAPKNRKMPSFIASLAPLCALCPRVRLQYHYDSRPSALLLQVIIEGAQSSGKSFAADIESLIMNDTLKAHDQQMRRQEQEYRELKKRRKANEKIAEEPQTTIRVVPPTISKTVLTKRADLFQRVLGDTLTFWMFAEELAQVTDAGKQGYSNLRTIMRTAYDLGSLFGIDFASDNSYSAIVDINICSMFCATPAAIDEYFDRKAIEGGNITRCIVCNLDETIGEDGAIFTPYSAQQHAAIAKTLQQLMDATYTPDGMLQPVVNLDMTWLDKTVCRWCKDKGLDATKSGNTAIDVFRKRASVSAFRVAALCYYLYLLEKYTGQNLSLALSGERVPEGHERGFVKQIYLFMADYILNALMQRWGKRFVEANAKRDADNRTETRPQLFDILPKTFTREQLRQQIELQKLVTPERIFICQWKKHKLIQFIDKNTFQKI